MFSTPRWFPKEKPTSPAPPVDTCLGHSRKGPHQCRLACGTSLASRSPRAVPPAPPQLPVGAHWGQLCRDLVWLPLRDTAGCHGSRRAWASGQWGPGADLWTPLVKPNAPSEGTGEHLQSQRKVPAETQKGTSGSLTRAMDSAVGPAHPKSSPSGPQEAVGGQGPLACLLTNAPAPHQSLLDRSASQGWDRRAPVKPHFPIRHQQNSSRTKRVGRGGLRTLRTETGLPVHAGLPSRGQPPPRLVAPT